MTIIKTKKNLFRAFAVFAAVLIIVGASLMFAMPAAALSDNYPRVIDNADLLTSEEEAELMAKLDEISERQSFDLLVITENSVGGKTGEAFADDFWDQNGFGYGDDHDGAMVLLNMGDRQMHIGTCGYGITALTDYGINRMESEIIPFLKSGDYFKAFSTFADKSDEYVTSAKNGHPFDVPPGGAEEKPAFPAAGGGAAALGIGAASSAIVTTRMKSKLKTVRYKPAAKDYIVAGSFIVNEAGSHDTFLYSNVVATPIPTDDDDDRSGGFTGGSTTHMSSGGISHGGHTSSF